MKIKPLHMTVKCHNTSVPMDIPLKILLWNDLRDVLMAGWARRSIYDNTLDITYEN